MHVFRRFTDISSARLLVPFIAVGILAATASAAASSRSSTLVITLKSVTISMARHDAPPAGVNGDRFLLRSRLSNASEQFDRPAGVVVGGDRYTLTFTSETAWTTTGVTTLPGGTLRWSGHGRLAKGRRASTIQVTSGTGAFAGARGSLAATDEGRGKALDVYRLTLP